MPRRKRRISDDDLEGLRPTAVIGNHTHVAEIHGENATLGLREWAKRAVLAGAPQR